MAKEPTKTGTIGEVAPASERVAFGASGAALASAGAVTGEPRPVGEGTARPEGAAVVGSIAEAAALLDAPATVREVPGPGVGAERVAERVASVQDRPLFDPARREPVWPSRPLLDPSDVAGRRPVDVAARITHDDVDYAPDHPDLDRRTVLLSFKSYSELVAIGAVIPLSRRDLKDWADDED